MTKLVPNKVIAKMEAAMYKTVCELFDQFLPQLELLGWTLHDEVSVNGHTYTGTYWGDTYFLVVDLFGVKVYGRDEDNVNFLKWEVAVEPKWKELQEAVAIWQTFRNQYWEPLV